MPPNFTWTEWTFLARNWKGSLITLSELRAFCWLYGESKSWGLLMEVVSCTCGLWGGNPVEIKDCRLGVHFIFSLKSGWLQIIFRAFWESSSAFPLLLPAHKPLKGQHPALFTSPASSCYTHSFCPIQRIGSCHSTSSPWWEKICASIWPSPRARIWPKHWLVWQVL